MTRKPLFITASVLAAAALGPATASADVKLGGAPTLRLVDSDHAQLRFASDRLPRTQSGRLSARVFFGGKRVSSLKATGRHGADVIYSARITSDRELRVGTKYTVRIVVPGQEPIVRKVKLHDRRA